MEYKNYNYSNRSEVIKFFSNNENIIEAIVGAINGIDYLTMARGDMY